MTVQRNPTPRGTYIQLETGQPVPSAIPADRLLESAIPAIVMSDQPTLRTLETLASRVTAPENWERYFTLRAVYKALLEETARNLRLVRQATGRETRFGAFRYGIHSEGKHGGPTAWQP